MSEMEIIAIVMQVHYFLWAVFFNLPKLSITKNKHKTCMYGKVRLLSQHGSQLCNQMSGTALLQFR